MVDIGAFRTYPQSDVAPQEQPGGHSLSHIPSEKIKEFGMHYKEYYSLDISFYRCEHDTIII